MAALARRWAVDPQDSDAYIRALISRRTAAGVFAAKVQWWQYARFLANPAGAALLDGADFIYLFRNDLLGQAISLHLSMETGRWGLDDRAATRVANPRFYDYDLLDRRVREMAAADGDWRIFFARAGIRPLFIAYEDLIAEPDAAVRRIIQQFGLTSRAERPYVEARVPWSRQEGEPGSADIRAGYLGHRTASGRFALPRGKGLRRWLGLKRRR